VAKISEIPAGSADEFDDLRSERSGGTIQMPDLRDVKSVGQKKFMTELRVLQLFNIQVFEEFDI
jgi:hypothetical protein